MLQAVVSNTHAPASRHAHRSAPIFLEREVIEAAIEHLIAALDVIDGDPDLEEDDDSFDECDLGEGDESRGVALPLYGVDQTVGPTNEDEAIEGWQRSGQVLAGPAVRQRSYELLLAGREPRS